MVFYYKYFNLAIFSFVLNNMCPVIFIYLIIISVFQVKLLANILFVFQERTESYFCLDFGMFLIAYIY